MTTALVVSILEEHVVPGKRLGRHVEHDPRSRNFPFHVAAPLPLKSVDFIRLGGWLNQLGVGSCTGNAMTAALNTKLLLRKDAIPFKELDALSIYSAATAIDNIVGSYPPTDTGSTGIAVCKVAMSRGLIRGYRHSFNLSTALQALMRGPWLMGCCWYEGFDTPDENGVVKTTGQIRGGHEVMSRRYQMLGSSASLDDRVWFDNSWGNLWGKGGRFALTVRDLGTLLGQQGDVTIPLRILPVKATV